MFLDESEQVVKKASNGTAPKPKRSARSAGARDLPRPSTTRTTTPSITSDSFTPPATNDEPLDFDFCDLGDIDLDDLDGLADLELVRQDQDQDHDQDQHRELAPYFPSCQFHTTQEDGALGFFVSNYVEADNGAYHGHFEYLKAFSDQTGFNHDLSFFVKAVAQAGFSVRLGSNSLMKEARKNYASAIQVTNAKLIDSEEAVKDSTLIGVILLSMFETITCNDTKSLDNWTNHIGGVSALLKLRGNRQFETSMGLRMFGQSLSNIILRSMQCVIPVGDDVVELRDQALENFDWSGPAMLVADVSIKFVNLRARVRAHEYDDLRFIIGKFRELDTELLGIQESLPVSWLPQVYTTEMRPDLVYNKQFNVYENQWAAQSWSSQRSLRIFINQIIRSLYVYGFANEPSTLNTLEDTAGFQIATDNMKSLAAEFCATIPQQAGYLHQLMPFAKRLESSAPLPDRTTPVRNTWADDEVIHFDTHRRPFTGTNTAPPRAAGNACMIIWSMFLVGSTPVIEPHMKDWIVQSLKYIGHDMGLLQAIVLAGMMERGEDYGEEPWFAGGLNRMGFKVRPKY